jgi:hypothetical protein
VRGRSADYVYLEPEILKILKTSNVPMSALGVNFRVNNKLSKIVELNTVKRHLESLVDRKKILKAEKDNITLYRVNSRKKLN